MSGNCTAKVADPLEVTLLVVTPLLVALGVAANTLNIVVLTRKWMTSSTNNYLTALAVADLAYLTVFYIITVKFYPGVINSAWFAHLLSYLFPLANLLSNYATWLTCLFTFERWLVIYKPMFGRKHCTRRRAKHLIAGMLLATGIFTIPNFFEYCAMSRVVRCGNATLTEYRLGQTEAYAVIKQFGYYHIFAGIFVFGPLVFLVVFNGLLIRSVVRARRKRAAMGGGGAGSRAGGGSGGISNRRSGAEQQKVTTMLIAVVLVFCLCQLPSAIMTLRKAMQRADDRRRGREMAERVANALVNILLLANAACNFVLYSCFSTRFRGTFRQVFLGCGRRNRRTGGRLSGGGVGGVSGGGGSGGAGAGEDMRLMGCNNSIVACAAASTAAEAAHVSVADPERPSEFGSDRADRGKYRYASAGFK